MNLNARVAGFLTMIIVSLHAGAGNPASSCLPCPDSVRMVLKKTADWQIANFHYTESRSHDYSLASWTNATLYLGMLRWASIAPDSSYNAWITAIAMKNDWKLSETFAKNPRYAFYHADELCMGQTYLALYRQYGKCEMIANLKKRLDWIMENPPDSSMNQNNKQVWTWSDALFMAPPVFAGIARAMRREDYLRYMDTQYKRSYRYLFDKEDALFYRDGSYFNKKGRNGKKIFWGRGNGWVAAGVVNLLRELPDNSPYRPFYRQVFLQLMPRLAALQDSNGFWHSSLLDTENYPAPETSATALITYALAYGVNAGLLDKTHYMPVIRKAWLALVSAVGPDGKLGWVQPIGADPANVTRDMTAVYGVGAFLMAGTEIYELCNKNN